MASVCLLLVVGALMLGASPSGADQSGPGSVFLPPQTAHAVLRRLRRFNSGLEEVLQKANLERECREERCSMEEAREYFENDEKTMEFWAGYIDGDQCQPQPCQNGGACTDGVGSYVCWCKANFDGKNCEIEVDKLCTVDNGGCAHFCEMIDHRAACQCASGYTLGADRKTCDPTEPFSCGIVGGARVRSLLSPRSFNRSDPYFADYDYDYNITALYDQGASYESGGENRSRRSVEDTEVTKVVYWDDAGRVVDANETALGGAFYPTSPTITAEENSDQRIVGGDEAKPGEIPWQVALMSYSESLQKDKPFCGGSLLSEFWVITAAHCLVNAMQSKKEFFVRLGEHDFMNPDGPERDHQVAEQHVHHMYGRKKSQFNHDIALLKLSSPVELSERRRPICLGPRDFTESILRSSANALVSGWGRVKFRGPQASKLQKLEVPYVDRTSCKQKSRSPITHFMFCAGYLSEQKDSCQGDSGGPHATSFRGTWFLTGIVSWGEDCAKDGKYGVYTRVSRYFPWISQKTGIQINI
ncbi:coagulation factor IX-like [Neosynchiropus ocellatus]